MVEENGPKYFSSDCLAQKKQTLDGILESGTEEFDVKLFPATCSTCSNLKGSKGKEF